MSRPLFEIENLHVEFSTYGGTVKAVRGVDLSVGHGETLAIVGESGCGKSVTFQSSFGLIPMPPGRITQGSVRLNGKELLGSSTKNLLEVRGKEVGFIFQDPMTSLNPTMTLGQQIAEVIIEKTGASSASAMNKAVELLELVRIPDARGRVNQYPFQFSGGMRQRVMIAMALACEPSLLIADEPTTALDVTVQSQILDLLRFLQKQRQMSLVLITHDLGVVAQMADRVAVMYAGQVVETGSVRQILKDSKHPYTIGLRKSLPNRDRTRSELTPIDGMPPDLFSPPTGCAFAARCQSAMSICRSHNPSLIQTSGGSSARCWLQDSRVQNLIGAERKEVRVGGLL